MRQSIAVLVPCRDEESTVAGVVRGFLTALPGCTVHVCDNASTDRTAVVAATAGATVVREPAPGKGNALRRLLVEVDADVYVVVDGDGTYDPSAAPALVRALREHELAMVVGARVPVTNDADGRRGHRLGNALVTSAVRLLFGGQLTDVLSGYRVLSRELVDELSLRSAGFDVEVELTARALRAGARCAEIRTAYTARPPGSVSKLRTWRDGRRILSRLVAVHAEPGTWTIPDRREGELRCPTP